MTRRGKLTWTSCRRLLRSRSYNPATTKAHFSTSTRRAEPKQAWNSRILQCLVLFLVTALVRVFLERSEWRKRRSNGIEISHPTLHSVHLKRSQ